MLDALKAKYEAQYKEAEVTLRVYAIGSQLYLSNVFCD